MLPRLVRIATMQPTPRTQTTMLPEVRQQVQEALPDAIALYRFGSVADGTDRAGSDLDLAVLPRQPLPALQRWRLQEDLAAVLGRDVDLIDLRSASTVMRAQVLRQGEVVVAWDLAALRQFEMDACATYALLNEERAAIVTDIQSRGRVHGR